MRRKRKKVGKVRKEERRETMGKMEDEEKRKRKQKRKRKKKKDEDMREGWIGLGKRRKRGK